MKEGRRSKKTFFGEQDEIHASIGKPGKEDRSRVYARKWEVLGFRF